MRFLTYLCLTLVAAWLTLPASGRSTDFETPPNIVVENFLATAKVGEPSSYKNLTLYPVILSSRQPLTEHLTLDEALARKSLVVKEATQDGRVNELVVNNTGKLPVYIMAGEILVGAKQDRVLQDDLWLPAVSGDVQVAAFCVERGRWSYQTPNFNASRPAAANISVRAAARESKDQSSVWSAVEATQSKAGYADSTNLGLTYEAPAIKADLSGYTDALKDFAQKNPEARGVVVQIGNHILAADLFNERTGFAEKFPKLLPSYAMEAYKAGTEQPSKDSDEARRFLRSIAAARVTTTSTPGDGTLVSLGSGDVSGSGLLIGYAVVHLEAFPHGKGEPNPPVIPIQRQYPRDY